MKRDGFMPFPRAFAQIEMLIASSKIWTLVAGLTFYKDIIPGTLHLFNKSMRKGNFHLTWANSSSIKYTGVWELL